MKNLIRTVLLVLFISCSCSGRTFKLQSPDERLKAIISSGGEKGDTSVFSFELYSDGKKLLLPSSLYLEFSNYPDKKFEIISTETSGKTAAWVNNFGEKKDIPDNYNELRIQMKSDKLRMDLVFRIYNEGAAFAYEFPEMKDSIIIGKENILFRFTADHMAWSAPRAQALYRHVPLSHIDKGCERPLVIEKDSSAMLALGEAALIDYPRMKFDPDSAGGYAIKSRLEEQAVKMGSFHSPWRYVLVGKTPGDLLERNYMILNLNDPSSISDETWIKPGKALREVTLTTSGGRAAVDFTSTHGMQYVEFDAGWYGPENNDLSDARGVNVDPARSKGPLDLREVINYAGTKGIGILLYVNRKALERQIDSLLPVYREWGVKGIKFGFVQVGGQKVTSWLHESVKKAAEYKMVVDIHDEYRPTGFSRTYPNLLTQEGIRGDEESPSNSHTLITMFTRMIAGAGDNTVCYYNERVDKKMGSHASQLAKTVCIFSPLQFLYWYDRAADIGNETELEFFSNVPTVWDKTKVIHAKIGEYGVIARQKGEDWFIGGINGEKAKNLDIGFGFLEEGKKYTAKIYTDDPAVETITHVRTDSLEVDNTYTYHAEFASNTGLAIHLSPVNK